MKIKVTNDNVLLKQFISETKTSSGILLSSESQDKKNFAKVIDIIDTDFISIGATVIFDTYATKKVKFENEDYLICKTTDILAVVED